MKFNFLKTGYQSACALASKVKDTINVKVIAPAAVAIGFGMAGAVPAHADLSTDLGAVTTSATAGIATVSTNQVTIMEAVFGLVLFAIGFRWLLRSSKAS
jgi:hypothetical protein